MVYLERPKYQTLAVLPGKFLPLLLRPPVMRPKRRRNLKKFGSSAYVSYLTQLKDEVRKEARKSHREKVEAFNAHLDSLTDINDLPKIGPG